MARPLNFNVAADVKTYDFQADSVAGATHFELLLDPDGAAGPEPELQLPVDGTDAPGGTRVGAWITPPVHLHGHPHAQFRVRACDSDRCGAASDPVQPDISRTMGFIKDNSARPHAEFGHAVALSHDGGVMAVAAPRRGVGSEPRGDVLVFTREGNRWNMFPLEGVPSSKEYGISVALSGDGRTLAVGSPVEGGLPDANGSSMPGRGGQVRVFERAQWGWQIASEFFAEDYRLDPMAHFGYTLSLSSDGRTLAVGAPGASGFDGAAFVFELTDPGWVPSRVPAPGQGLAFGTRLALSGDGKMLVVSGAIDPFMNGPVFAIARTDQSWGPPVPLQTPARTGDTSLVLSNDGTVLALGAPLDGQVHLFTRNGGSFIPAGTLSSPAAQPGDLFGSTLAVSADGRTLAVGAVNASQPGAQPQTRSGAVHIFRRPGTAWTQAVRLASAPGLGEWRIPSPNVEAYLPTIALSGDGKILAAGDPYESSKLDGISAFPVTGNGLAPRSGAVYLY